MFRTPRFKERGASRYMESWQSCCSYSERQSKDHMGLFAYRFAPISCRNYAFCFCVGNERCLTEYHQWCLQWSFCLKIPGPFHVSICRPIQLNTMVHDCLPRLLKAHLGDCFIDCCVAHGDRIDNERMDMINAPQAPECHVVAELWLHLATCWGIQLDFACQPNRSR